MVARHSNDGKRTCVEKELRSSSRKELYHAGSAPVSNRGDHAEPAVLAGHSVKKKDMFPKH
jgi:hypothetical protein